MKNWDIYQPLMGVFGWSFSVFSLVFLWCPEDFGRISRWCWFLDSFKLILGRFLGKMTPVPGLAPGMASRRAIVAIARWHLGSKVVVPGTLRRVAGRGLRAAHRGWSPGAAGRHQGHGRSGGGGLFDWEILGTIGVFEAWDGLRWDIGIKTILVS